MIRKIIYFFYFLSPFFVWFLFYLKKPDFVVIFRRPLNETSLFIYLNDLWQVILIFFVFQLGNTIIAKIFKEHKIFGKINLIFIFFHFLVALYLFIFNFY
jgi:hypothetical protein